MNVVQVGDNTFPNVMPLLAGLAEDELRAACPWPSTHHKLDPCPFIWKRFASQGYRSYGGSNCSRWSYQCNRGYGNSCYNYERYC